MLKKSITFETFDGETVTEDHYFHLSKADLVTLEAQHKGGLGAWIQQVVEAENAKEILAQFKQLIEMSYGRKSDDGRRFVKNDSLWEDFASSPAYDALFFELVTDPAKASEFINGIVPADLEKLAASRPQAVPDPPEETENVFEKDVAKVLTQRDVVEMDPTDLQAGLASGRYKLS